MNIKPQSYIVGIHLALLLGVIGLLIPGGAAAADITRQEIQTFFVHHSGNSVRTAHWANTYQGKHVAWEGVVYKIKKRPKSHRVEVMVRVLNDALLYDTMVILEGDTRLNPAVRKDIRIRFHGKIIHGIDVLGVKQVQVLAPRPDAIQLN